MEGALTSSAVVVVDVVVATDVAGGDTDVDTAVGCCASAVLLLPV